MKISEILELISQNKKVLRKYWWMQFTLILLCVPFLNQILFLIFLPQMYLLIELILVNRLSNNNNRINKLIMLSALTWIIIGIIYHLVFNAYLSNQVITADQFRFSFPTVAIQVSILIASIYNIIILFKLRKVIKSIKSKIKTLEEEVELLRINKFEEDKNKENNLYESIFGIVK